MKRRTLLSAVGLAPVFAWGQSAPAKVGFLHPRLSAVIEPLRLAAVREGLAGGATARPVTLVARVADGSSETLRAYAEELAASGLDAIIAVSPAGVRAAREATGTTPIVAVDLESDPVAAGWVLSLARPGGNVTGLFLDFADFAAKCLQLLVEALPGLSRVGVVWDPTTGDYQRAAVDRSAPSLGVALTVRSVDTVSEIEPTIRSLSLEGVQAVLFLSSPLFSANTTPAAGDAAAARLPAIMLFPEFARDGGLIGYGPDLQDMFRRAGITARRIVDGAQVALVPLERPSRFNLAINLKTARVLGVGLAPTLLARADEVIE